MNNKHPYLAGRGQLGAEGWEPVLAELGEGVLAGVADVALLVQLEVEGSVVAELEEAEVVLLPQTAARQ